MILTTPNPQRTDGVLSGSAYLHALADLITSSRRSVRSMMYALALPVHKQGRHLAPIWDAMLAAPERGVQCSMLLNSTAAYHWLPAPNRDAATILTANGWTINRLRGGNSPSRAHAKIWIIDDRYLLIGSHNLSSGDPDSRLDVSAVLSNPALLAQALRLWRQSLLHADRWHA